MLRGEAAHTGFVPFELKRPFRLAWAREIEGERLGTAMEPLIGGRNLFVATHAGNLYALDADTGEGRWRFQAHGPFLHSPALTEDFVFAASIDGNVYAVSQATGKLAWRFYAGRGGCSASPLVYKGAIYLGTRSGDFLCLSARQGKLLWRAELGKPIRQTAAAADGRIFVTAEDLVVRCFRADDGRQEWSSEPLAGQTARDYYPVVIQRQAGTYVVVRTNPLLNMGQRIGRDRDLLCRTAAIPDSSWKQLEAWMRSDRARGNPELWAKEQTAIVNCLETDPMTRSFFVLDGATGKEVLTAPVLWVAGCQGVAAPPALTADGRPLVLRRTAYGNWNLGVAPLVGLGLLDLESDRIQPLFHSQGAQPPWNCFWGTADESQNFVIAGETVLIVHQGTLSGFDLRTHELFPIYGERDTYGGLPNPAWARNEWHGPARSGVAVAGNRIYWQTGSRILCLESSDRARPPQQPKPVLVETNIPTERAAILPPVDWASLRQRLTAATGEVISHRWAPLFTDPGLAGRIFSFDQSAELFEALACAYPHLPAEVQVKVKTALRAEWVEHPPFTRQAWYPLSDGARREWFHVPAEYCERLGGDKVPDPFGNVQAIWYYAQRCGEISFVLESWPKLKAAFEQFSLSGWRLDPAKGDPFANRYLASLLAFGRLANQAGDASAALQAANKAAETTEALGAWWKRAAQAGTLTSFNKASELDPFIGKGDAISLALAPHRHKLALFQDLTPEVARLVRSNAASAVNVVWAQFASLCPTWYCMGEERQIHFGENFLDAPEFALSAFRALAWLRDASSQELASRVDLPFCRADLSYLTKVALALDAAAGPSH